MHIIFSTYDGSGVSIYWNDDKLSIESYERKTKHYYCGKDLLNFDTHRTKIYTLLVVDLDDVYCADVYTDAEIVKRFEEHSAVPHKMKKGGQSAKRFSQIRDNEITLWFKRIDEYLKKIDTEVYLGINFVYKKRFLKILSTYNEAKIKEIHKNEYSGLTGIYQFINKLEGDKK